MEEISVGRGKGWGCCGGRKDEAGEAGKKEWCLSFGFLRVLIDLVAVRGGFT